MLGTGPAAGGEEGGSRGGVRCDDAPGGDCLSADTGLPGDCLSADLFGLAICDCKAAELARVGGAGSGADGGGAWYGPAMYDSGF